MIKPIIYKKHLDNFIIKSPVRPIYGAFYAVGICADRNFVNPFGDFIYRTIF